MTRRKPSIVAGSGLLGCLSSATLLGCPAPQSCEPDCVGLSATGTGSEGASAGTGDTETGEEVEPDPACLVDEPIVVIETDAGTMVVQLDAARAPITVANFVDYLSAGFYDGLIFHRVIDGFVIQSGWMLPGMIERPPSAGPIVRELDPELVHVDGAIAMARRDEPDTAQAQWYITDGAQAALDGQYAVFGVMIDGFEVRDAISAVETETAMWMEFEIPEVPLVDVVVDAVYCVDAWP